MASEKISAMPAASTPDGAELVPVVQGGVNKKLALSAAGPGLLNIPSANILGTSTNNDAAAGIVGQYLEDLTEQVAPEPVVTLTPLTLALITLTPGDWDLSGFVAVNFSIATVGTVVAGYSWPGSGHLQENETSWAQVLPPANLISGVQTLIMPTRRITVAAASTLAVALDVIANIAAGTLDAWGTVSARRVR